MVDKFRFEKSRFEIIMVEKSAVEKFLLAFGLNCLGLKLWIDKSMVEISCNHQTIITSDIHNTHLFVRNLRVLSTKYTNALGTTKSKARSNEAKGQ